MHQIYPKTFGISSTPTIFFANVQRKAKKNFWIWVDPATPSPLLLENVQKYPVLFLDGFSKDAKRATFLAPVEHLRGC